MPLTFEIGNGKRAHVDTEADPDPDPGTAAALRSAVDAAEEHEARCVGL